MGQREDIVKIAVAELGYKEGANNNTKYGKWYGMNYNPWCAMFVSWCADKAGVADLAGKYASVPTWVRAVKAKGQFRAKGAYIPRPGDIIFFGDEAHVGLVEKVEGDTLYTIEGNTSAGGNSSNGDGVYRRKRQLNHRWIMGYGVPEYKEDEEVIKRDQTITVNGKRVVLPAANIADENYFRIRDIAPALGFKVEWDAVKREIVLTKG